MSEPTSREKPDLRPKLHELPHKPGVYLMRDRFRKVIYVGKARDLRKRVSQYFMASKKRTADLKTRALIDSVWDLEWHTVRSEPEALLLEGRLIKEFRPKYNVSFRDDKRFLMVKVDLAEDWPRFRLARFRRDDNARYFGPYANAGALRQTLHFMRKRFGVLTSGRGEPGERELKSSAFQVLMKLNQFAVEAYRERVEQGCEFLSGQSRELLDELREEMKKAAGKLEFERAAELRNMIDNLKATTTPTRRFTGYNLLPSTIDPEADMKRLGEALSLRKAPRVMECFDISNISTTHIVASMVCFRDGVPDKDRYRRFRITTVKGQDDFASMGEVVRRRYSGILREMKQSPERAARLPDLIIVDGGKGQLSSACRELHALGLEGQVPIIGLAKEFEEIHRPGEAEALILPGDSPALKLLQRIRDEAHRFANGYHQLLMKRRISESILDDCPGVSEARKEALLRRFGSVARLRRASAEEVATIPGIGPKLAGQIVEYLLARKRES